MGATLGLFWSAWTRAHRTRPNIDPSANTRRPNGISGTSARSFDNPSVPQGTCGGVADPATSGGKGLGPIDRQAGPGRSIFQKGCFTAVTGNCPLSGQEVQGTRPSGIRSEAVRD